jgi:F-type H+-transporting ATPase subunit epsilon
MDAVNQLQLRVLLPTRELINVIVSKIVADAVNGSFCLLPRHIDFVTALVPGVLTYNDIQSHEHFVGIDEGILVKCGQDVSVSTVNGVLGDSLGELRDQMKAHFAVLSEQERRSRAALARLEASTLRGFWDTREQLRE